MKNKKGFKLSIGDIVIIILGVSMTILLLVLYANMDNYELEPVFTIRVQELIVHTEIYRYCNEYCSLNNESDGCVKYPCSNLIQTKEIDEIYYKDDSGLHILTKENLTIEWLTDNCIDYQYNGTSVKTEDGFSFKYKCADYLIDVTYLNTSNDME